MADPERHSVAVLLDHLGLTDHARRIERAVDQALLEPDARTPDLGGPASTERLAEAVRLHLE